MSISFDLLQKTAQASFHPSTLYVVATPIGNLSDISARGLAALSSAHIVCAEDTRVARQLLRAYGIRSPRLVSIHEHNECSMIDPVIRWLAEGQTVALVSDAGTPAVSDPGARLVRAVRNAGYSVCPIPGPNAAIAALSVSGAAEQSFMFYGFLPAKSSERRRILTQWQTVPYLTICYEAPHRIAATLADIVRILGAQRPVMLARELTKAFETFKVLPAEALLDWVQSDNNQQRGEIVLMIDAAPAPTTLKHVPDDVLNLLRILVAELPIKQATNLVAHITGLSRKVLYKQALQIK